MAKSFGGLWEKVVDVNNLVLAYENARRHKRYKPEVLAFGNIWSTEINRIQHELILKTWLPSPCREFIARNEVKRRIIQAPEFADRVVHHALSQVTAPLLEKTWIEDTFACRIGKGTHRAVDRLQGFMRRAVGDFTQPTVVQIDISKYFASINHCILLGQLEEKFREREVLWLYESIIQGHNKDCSVGLPIGALTSQNLANHYLSKADHFAKECIGAKFYLRYMDDMVMILPTKKEAVSALRDMKWLCETELHLKLNPKSQVYPLARMCDFCGFRTSYNHILPRKRIVKAAKMRFKKITRAYARRSIAIEKVNPVVMSFLGYMQHCDGYRTTVSTLKHLKLQRGCDYHEENNV